MRRGNLQVSRSLTIKQMAMVATVAIVFISIFSVTLLFHFVQQNRYITAMQMESVARAIRTPLSNAILKADIPQAEIILNQIQPAGIISRADVVLPNQFQALRVSFGNEKPIPQLLARLFELPLQITLPLYSLARPANPQPLAYLVLQADSEQMYRFIISTLSTLITTWLLLSLTITVALTWCINRLMVHPLRKIAREFDGLSSEQLSIHQLAIPALHHDDEIGLLVRAYNLNQRLQQQRHEELNTQATHFALSNLPNKRLITALLQQHLDNGDSGALLMIGCETLHDASGVLNAEQREVLLLTLVQRIRNLLSGNMVLGQVDDHIFVVIVRGISHSWQVMSLAETLRSRLMCRLPVYGLQLMPDAAIGIAMQFPGDAAEPLYRRAMTAYVAAQQMSDTPIQFFDPQQMEQAHRRLTEVHDLQSGLKNGQYALWLQPQVALDDGRIQGAEALLRQRQPDGSWALPEGLIAQIERCGQMVNFGNWILEETCRVLAGWQRQGIMLNISVNISAVQITHSDLTMVTLDLLKRYQVAPHLLTLEITESHQLNNVPAAIEVLRPLREAGVLIALDDFGIGYSSLAQLHHIHTLPVDVLKLDKLFVDNLPHEARIASAIINLAHSLNLMIIAEGVETEVQRKWLHKSGVQLAQGFLFAKAQRPEVLIDMIVRQDSE